MIAIFSFETNCRIYFDDYEYKKKIRKKRIKELICDKLLFPNKHTHMKESHIYVVCANIGR